MVQGAKNGEQPLLAAIAPSPPPGRADVGGRKRNFCLHFCGRFAIMFATGTTLPGNSRAVVAQLDRALDSDNSDRQLGAAEKPYNKAIFRHRILRFCSSLTTI